MNKVTGLKNLFATKDSTDSNVTSTQDPAIASNKNGNDKQEGETYNQYGVRIAGLCTGDLTALTPALQTVIHAIRKEQAQDQCLQQELQQKLNAQLEDQKVQLSNKQNLLSNSKDTQNKLCAEIKKAEGERDRLKGAQYQRNKTAWYELIISSIILLPFTIYLFIFYGSVAYSAFFKEFSLESLSDNGDFNMSQAIFDSTAFSSAWNAGIGEFLFILFMPVIFLAFGFVLNKWEKEKGIIKYIKIPTLIVVAFIFDTLLAYEICEKIYNLNSMISLEATAAYELSFAFQDPRFWVIIFLGFVSYFIWGFVFGYFINSLEDLDLNKTEMKNCENQIAKLNKDLNQEKAIETDLKKQIGNIENDIKNTNGKLGNSTRYDLTKMKLELNNFMTGWNTFLNGVNKPENEKAQAQHTFNEIINTLENVQYEK